MKQLEVSILGQVYVLGCPEGGEALLRSAVASVDTEMSAIRSAGKVKARERIAVLAALNLAYQLAERGGALDAGAPPAAEGAASALGNERDRGDSGDMGQRGDGVDIAALIARVDDALGDDGQLL